MVEREEAKRIIEEASAEELVDILLYLYNLIDEEPCRP